MGEQANTPVGLENPTGHDHGLDHFRAAIIEALQNDAAQGKGQEMGFFHPDVINGPQDVVRHDVEIIAGIMGLQVLRITVVPHVDEEKVKEGFEGFDLMFPGDGTATGAMNEHHPVEIIALMMDFMVEDIGQNPGVDGVG